MTQNLPLAGFRVVEHKFRNRRNLVFLVFLVN